HQRLRLPNSTARAHSLWAISDCGRGIGLGWYCYAVHRWETVCYYIPSGNAQTGLPVLGGVSRYQLSQVDTLEAQFKRARTLARLSGGRLPNQSENMGICVSG
ncbi:hypothetical protein FOZ63_024887, partial [Perkinsus olseni]